VTVSKKKKPATKAKPAAEPKPSVRRRAKELPFIVQANPLRQLRWPEPLDLIKQACAEAIEHCSAEEAEAVGEFLVDAGIRLLEMLGTASILVVHKNGPINRLVGDIMDQAHEHNVPVSDLTSSLQSALDTIVDDLLAEDAPPVETSKKPVDRSQLN
jgi:hypothetical protein